MANLGISAAQIRDWRAFEMVYGPILLHDRIDAAAARVCYWLAGAPEGSPPDDFMPVWGSDAPTTPEQSPEEMMAQLRTIQKQQRRRPKKRKKKVTPR